MQFLYQTIVGFGSGGGTLTVGFMVERLLLESWEWWMWGVASLPFIALTIFSAWRLHKMDSPTDKLAHDVNRLQRAVAEPDEKKRAAILGYHDARDATAVLSVGRPQASTDPEGIA